MSFVNNELNLAKISLFLDKNKKIYKKVISYSYIDNIIYGYKYNF